MSVLYLAAGLFALTLQGFVYFMLVVFSIPGTEINKTLLTFLNGFAYLLPLVCVLAAILLIFGYFQGWNYVYRWILLPIPFAVLFLIVRLFLIK